jgi:hypothetical protein|tara:strand:+ start:672 stop:1166 length:495 start_codon:yes stop_codon:yes gene_type:complete
MYLKALLFYFLSFNIFANSQIDNINNFLDANRFSYEQVTENSNDVISGKLILDTLQIYLEIISPYKESYLISKNFITYNDIDFSQQRTFEYSKKDFPIISIISKKKIPQDDDSLNILTLEDSVYVTDKLTKQIFKFSLREEETLIIQFKDSFGVGNSIYLNKLS